jgi:hypothetical protein
MLLTFADSGFSVDELRKRQIRVGQDVLRDTVLGSPECQEVALSLSAGNKAGTERESDLPLIGRTLPCELGSTCVSYGVQWARIILS